jgi:hypothetical protein
MRFYPVKETRVVLITHWIKAPDALSLQMVNPPYPLSPLIHPKIQEGALWPSWIKSKFVFHKEIIRIWK